MATAKPDLKHIAKKAYADGDYDLAAKIFTQAINHGPTTDLYVDRAMVFIMLGNYADAIVDASKCIDLDPSKARGYTRKGAALMKMKKYQAAKKIFELGSSWTSDNSDIARLLMKCEKYIAEDPDQSEDEPVPAIMPKYRHYYYNKPTEVILAICAMGVPSDSITVHFGEHMLNVSIDIPGEERYQFQSRLPSKIVPERCSYHILPNEVVIHLEKTDQSYWQKLLPQSRTVLRAINGSHVGPNLHEEIMNNTMICVTSDFNNFYISLLFTIGTPGKVVLVPKFFYFEKFDRAINGSHVSPNLHEETMNGTMVSFSNLLVAGCMLLCEDYEFSWITERLHGQDILPQIRDQKKTDTCVFQALSATGEIELKRKAANRNPPESSDVRFCTDNFIKDYERLHGPIGSDDTRHERLRTALSMFKDDGVTAEGTGVPKGKYTIENHEPRRYSSFSQIAELIEEGRPVLGSVRLTKLFGRLKPGEIYDPDPTLCEKNDKEVHMSHAIVFIGHGIRDGRAYLVFLNSFGTDYCDEGFGRVFFDRVRRLITINIEI